MPTSLQVIDLECIRGDRELFSGLNFTLLPGQLLQIEGVNGSGKTSLLRIITGLSQPESGAVLWDSLPIVNQRSGYVRHIAYVGHAHGIKGELSPLENLRMHIGIGSTQTALSIGDALRRVGLHAFKQQPCSTLSFGQCKRVAIARLLLVKRLLWILDEPLSGLDYEGAKEMEGLLTSHIASGGMAVLTSHFPICNETINKQYLNLGP